MRGERILFKNVDLELDSGEWMHIRGENGVGKTSLIRILTGLAKPVAGNIYWKGQLIDDESEDYHRNLLFLGHRDALKDKLTAVENLQIAAALNGEVVVEDEALSALQRVGLRGREELPVSCLSAGQKRRVLLARLLTCKAKFWLLDEPFSVLDVNAVEMLLMLIRKHLANGGMTVMTSHQSIPIPNGKVLEL